MCLAHAAAERARGGRCTREVHKSSFDNVTYIVRVRTCICFVVDWLYALVSLFSVQVRLQDSREYILVCRRQSEAHLQHV